MTISVYSFKLKNYNYYMPLRNVGNMSRGVKCDKMIDYDYSFL